MGDMIETKFRPMAEIIAHIDILDKMINDEQYSESTQSNCMRQISLLIDIKNGKFDESDVSEMGYLLQNGKDIEKFGYYESDGILQIIDWVFGLCEFNLCSLIEEAMRSITDHERVKSVSFSCQGNMFRDDKGKMYRYIFSVYTIDNVHSFYANDFIECVSKAQEFLGVIDK